MAVPESPTQAEGKDPALEALIEAFRRHVYKQHNTRSTGVSHTIVRFEDGNKRHDEMQFVERTPPGRT